MEFKNILQTIINEPIYLSIVSILVLIIIYSILKRLFKLLIVVLSVLIIYVGYLIYTGSEIPGQNIINPIIEKIEDTSNKIGNAIDVFNNDENE